MTAHDPCVTLNEAEVDALCAATGYLRSDARRMEWVTGAVERIIAARLAPIRALAENYDGWEIDEIDVPWIALADLRAALDAPVSASQDHDGAEGQGEGEKPADRRCPTCGIPFAHYTHDPQGRPL